MQSKKITVLLFASIRERLGADRLQVSFEAGAASDIDALIAALCAERGADWAEVLCAANVIVAINQRVAERGDSLRDGDELAFFPPVTGG